jgi:hypothetical protein
MHRLYILMYRNQYNNEKVYCQSIFNSEYQVCKIAKSAKVLRETSVRREPNHAALRVAKATGGVHPSAARAYTRELK